MIFFVTQSNTIYYSIWINYAFCNCQVIPLIALIFWPKSFKLCGWQISWAFAISGYLTLSFVWEPSPNCFFVYEKRGWKSYLRGANIVDWTMVHRIYVYMQVLRQENNLGAYRGDYRELGLAGGSWDAISSPVGVLGEEHPSENCLLFKGL